MAFERFAVIDVETTGFSPARDRIVEMACVLVEGGEIAGRWSTLVNPGMPIPSYATAVHGIGDAMVRDAPCAAEALAELRARCAGYTVAAHCALFDLSFVGPAVRSEGLCTMRLARRLFPEAPNHRNQTLRRFLAIDRVAGAELHAHRALGDAIVTAHVLLACRRRFRLRHAGESWETFVQQHALVCTSPVSRAAPARYAKARPSLRQAPRVRWLRAVSCLLILAALLAGRAPAATPTPAAVDDAGPRCLAAYVEKQWRQVDPYCRKAADAQEASLRRYAPSDPRYATALANEAYAYFMLSASAIAEISDDTTLASIESGEREAAAFARRCVELYDRRAALPGSPYHDPATPTHREVCRQAAAALTQALERR